MNSTTYSRAALPLSEANRGLAGFRRETSPEIDNAGDSGAMSSVGMNAQQSYNIDKQINNLRRNTDTAITGRIAQMTNEQKAAQLGMDTAAYRAQLDLQTWTAGIMEGQAPATAQLGAMMASGDNSTLAAVASMRQAHNGMNLV